MRSFILIISILVSTILSAQIYTVNSDDDIDDGVCDGVHCSLREAINASETDGVPSTIKFNIPGVGPFTINPSGSFPNINHSNLTILGESQAGGPGAILIDFNFRDFSGIGFWDILASNFYISGIDFTDFQFKSVTDHIFKFGDFNNNSSNSRIYNCSFIQDNFVIPEPKLKRLINVFKADNLSISNCIFGTDRTKSNIYNLGGYISIDSNQKPGIVKIDSNIFANSDRSIEFSGGQLSVSNNIFGAVDTVKNPNLLFPENAIVGVNQDYQVNINDNFFFGYRNSAIRILSNSLLRINNNRFYDDTLKDIELIGGGSGGDQVLIRYNYARNGKLFLDSRKINDLWFESNNISRYDTVFYNLNDTLNIRIINRGNQMTCINKEVIVMDQAMYPSHPIPVISTVNNNQITGSGNPFDFVVVYTNSRISCPKAVCEAGFELGVTHADGNGNWILNAPNPVNASISAYQFNLNSILGPVICSEFTSCFQCPSPVKIDYNPIICSGQTITYRSKVYTELNPDDSIFIKGNGIICDSTIIVHLKVKPGYYKVTVSKCYSDSIQNDTIVLHDRDGCDSAVVLIHKYFPIDTSVISLGGSLIANENNADYQWIDCDNSFAILPNETSQQFTPTKTGNFAVIITKNGCKDTSSCHAIFILANNELEKHISIKIFPNPTNGILKIKMDEREPLTVIIYNSTGQKLSQLYSDSKIIEIDMSNYHPGIYYLRLIGKQEHQILRILKD